MNAALVPKLPVPDAFDADYLEYNGILPLEIVDQRLRVAVVGEPAVEVLDDLERSFDAPVELIPVTKEALQEAIRRTYASAESVVELVREGCERPKTMSGPMACPNGYRVRDLRVG